MTPLSPLQLRRHDFTHISVHANPNGTATGQVSLDQEISFQRNADSSTQWILGLRVLMKSSDPKNPFFYEIDVSMNGLVDIHADYPMEKREQVAVVNGLSILYSAIREVVLNITGRSVHGLMCLPTLSFVDVLAVKPPLEIPKDSSSPASKPDAPAA